jgi:pyruvate,water dikinase
MILRFDQELPVEIAGHKAHNLSRMWQAGLPVPPGFCITWEEIDNIGSCELDRALAELGAHAFAVRSSAIQEDALDASFAGMLLSRLNIRDTAGVLLALQEIRNSAAAPAALGYSRRLNVLHSPQAAAVVQAFLAAEASGVLFMRDPRMSARYLDVEACWGLGPGVVEGLVRPDRWIISADGTVISSHIADKDIAIVPTEHGGTTQTAVDPACRRRPCLSLGSLHQLSRLAAECERLFGSPQDIEWAVWDKRVWLLQSRPITASKLERN